MDSIHIGLTQQIVLSTKKLSTSVLVSPCPGAGGRSWSQSQTRPGTPWCLAGSGWAGLGMLNNCFHGEAISNYDPLIDSVSCLGTIMLSTKR